VALYIATLILDGVIIGGIYVLVAVGLTLTYGVMYILNFAHGEMLMWGAFLALVFSTGAQLGFVPAMILAALVLALAGIAIERLTFRRVRYDHLNGLILSMGLIAVLQNVALAIWGADPRSIPSPFPDVVRLGSIQFGMDRLVAFAISLVLVGLMSAFLRFTKTGKAIRAAAQNPEVAELIGINLDRIVTVTFAISSALAGAAGALFGMIFTVTPFMGAVPVMKGFVVVIMGGLGSVEGAILAGFLLGTAESLGGGLISPALKDGFGFLALIALLLWRPSGVLGRVLQRD
jgi:branched-chain amino acid transport system permease protein